MPQLTHLISPESVLDVASGSVLVRDCGGECKLIDFSVIFVVRGVLFIAFGGCPLPTIGGLAPGMGFEPMRSVRTTGSQGLRNNHSAIPACAER